MTVCTDRFRTVAEETCRSLGMAGLPLVFVPHPLSGMNETEVQDKADAVVEQVIQALTENKKSS